MRRAIGVVGELLITLGVVLLLFVAWQLWWTDVEANRAQAQTLTRLEQSFRAPGKSEPVRVHLDGDLSANAFGILRVPRFGADYARPIMEGIDLDVLSQGLGHYPDTAMPGEVGNFALAGHRVTWGRPLHDIDTMRPGDTMIVETAKGYDVYEMYASQIVLPSAGEVVAPVPGEPGAAPTRRLITLTACHPKFSAAERFIVHGELTGSFTHAEGLPADVLTVPTS